MRTRAVVAAACAVLLLAGCSVNAKTQLREGVRNLTVDANGRNSAAVRADAESLLQTIAAAVRSGDITAVEGQRLTALATLIRDQAALVDTTPTPSPTTASPTPSRTPSPSPSPTPSPTPSRTPSPTPSRSPSPTPTPTPSPAPIITLTPAAAVGSPTPSGKPSG